MYERHRQPLASRKVFASRIMRNGLIGLLLVFFSLIVGMLGYRFTEHLSWIDSLLNASMILSGMGPVNPVQTNAGKFFASFYALYSGIVPLAAAGVLAAPIFHRFLHHFHLEDEK
ncbi:MAG: hypothetical protein IT315_01635 [Anaerolineales bacterium]|nr:hypothetical protein [Anaerolineales bacterium]